MIYFMGGGMLCDWLTIMIPIESNIFGKLLTSNIMLVILGEYPTPQPLTPLDPYREVPYGGPPIGGTGGAWMRGVI